MKKPLLALFLLLLFFIPLFVLAKDFTVPKPTQEEVVQAILIASRQTNVRATLLYGLYGVESAYGDNLGKTESKWKEFCGKKENANSDDCENWRTKDCKHDYDNANHYEYILKNLGYINANGNADRNNIKTSSTCALGFTQVEPNTWWGVVNKLDNRKIYSPWDINDAFFISAHYLETLGANKKEVAESSEVISKKDRITSIL